MSIVDLPSRQTTGLVSCFEDQHYTTGVYNMKLHIVYNAYVIATRNSENCQTHGSRAQQILRLPTTGPRLGRGASVVAIVPSKLSCCGAANSARQLLSEDAVRGRVVGHRMRGAGPH